MIPHFTSLECRQLFRFFYSPFSFSASLFTAPVAHLLIYAYRLSLGYRVLVPVYFDRFIWICISDVIDAI